MRVASSSDTDTTVDLSALENLAPPCEYNAHLKYGEGPAEWAVWLLKIRLCGCPISKVNPFLLCQGCFGILCSTPRLSCYQCGRTTPTPKGFIQRAERI